ncbi:MAG: 6-phosphofructokinase, partial [Bacteroidota bacterium]
DDSDPHIKLGGISSHLRYQLEQGGCKGQVRTTVLGHIQRGGTPTAYDRILATSMGVKAFDLIKERRFGQMVSFRNNNITSVPILDAVKEYNHVQSDHYLIQTARKMGVSFGD